MDGMSMPGGWTLSMMWMRMPGQTWAGERVARVIGALILAARVALIIRAA